MDLIDKILVSEIEKYLMKTEKTLKEIRRLVRDK